MSAMPSNREGRHTAPDSTTDTDPVVAKSHWIREAVILVVAVAVVFLVARTFLVGTYSVPSASMAPTIAVGDRILVNKLSYHLHGVGESDIIVFTTPPNEHCGGGPVPDLVKRVVGLPGETISLSGGQLYINGKLLVEPWLPAVDQTATDPGPSTAAYSLKHPFKIPAKEVFVMGDNRRISCDSRFWGPVEESTIVGKVDLTIFPFSHRHWF
jgi:signal peptidase I